MGPLLAVNFKYLMLKGVGKFPLNEEKKYAVLWVSIFFFF